MRQITRQLRAAWIKIERTDDGDAAWFSSHQSRDFLIRYRDAAEYADIDIDYVLIRKLKRIPLIWKYIPHGRSSWRIRGA
jgi:hypothetical protein